MERPRRNPDPRIRDMLHSMNMWEVFLQLGGGMGYAGDDPDPRPLPPTTLSDHKQSMEAGLQAAHQRGVRHIDNALFFAFYSDRFKGETDRSIAVPRDDLWWLASAGDTVLLSDRVTHHYTGIFDVDRETERVSFLDQWPDRFFLKEGLNAAGVAAQAVGNKPLSITREEFRRVAIGLITMDTPALLEDYFAQHPDRAASVEINLSCGLCLLDVEKERFARIAAPYLRRALQLAEERGLQEKTVLAANKLFVALSVATYQAAMAGEPLAARPFQDELRRITSRTPQETILAGLDTDDFCRMGNAAGNAGELEAARAWFDRAVAIDPNHEQARWLRSIVRDQTQDFEGSAADAEEAVRLNIARVQAVEAERDALDSRDRFGRGAAESKVLALTRRRAEEYVLCFRGHLDRQNWDLARTAAAALIALTPDAADGYKRMAALEHRLGRVTETRQWLQQAIQREKAPDARQTLEGLLMEMSR
jgi:tetratricopeptide (TPR) repeat protein